MASFEDVARELGRQAARSMETPSPQGLTRRFGTVAAVGDSGTLDVEVGGATLRGMRMTTACAGAEVGDRCIVETCANLSVVTGIIAHDNRDYVSVPFSPNQGLLNYNAYVNSSFCSGGVVTLQLGVVIYPYTDWNSTDLVIGTVGEGFRPRERATRNRMLDVFKPDGCTVRGFYVEPDGTVHYVNSGSAVQDVWIVRIPGISYSAL